MKTNKVGDIILSVRLMTYNHSDYILEALNGINKQKTNFIFEVVIGDDFSSDDNLLKIKGFRFTNKNIIVNILEREVGDAYWTQRQKLGRLYNFINILENCQGKYIALLDGDDYWTDPNKLQKQVDFLEANPNYIASSHAYRNRFYGSNNNKESYGKIIKGRPMTFTLLYKNIIKEFPKEFTEASNGDTFLRGLLSEHGKFFYMDDIEPGIRGVHNNGLVSKLNELDLWPRRIKTHEALLNYYKGKEKEKFYREKVARFRIKYNSLLIQNASFRRKIELLKESIKEAIVGYSILYFIKLMIFKKD